MNFAVSKTHRCGGSPHHLTQQEPEGNGSTATTSHCCRRSRTLSGPTDETSGTRAENKPSFTKCVLTGTCEASLGSRSYYLFRCIHRMRHPLSQETDGITVQAASKKRLSRPCPTSTYGPPPAWPAQGAQSIHQVHTTVGEHCSSGCPAGTLRPRGFGG